MALYYVLPMQPTTSPARSVTARPHEVLADATAGAAAKSEGDGLPPGLADIADVIGAADDDLPSDLSARHKHYLRLWGYGRNRSARVRQQR